jgi:DNA mismatch repair protein MLH3
LTRAALRTAEFVQQVDRKFLMVNVKLIQEVFPDEEVVGGVSASRMDGEKKALKSCLVLIDQHAADERLRVERFLKLFGEGFLSWSPPASSLPAFPASSSSIDGIPTTPTPSLLILLTAPEHSHLAAHPRTLLALARWGILLRISSLLPSSSSTNPLAASQQETAFHQIHVDAVPALLHERLVGRRAPKTKRGTAGEGPVVLEQVVKEFLGVAMADGGEGIVEGILRAGRDRKGEEVGSKQEREEGKQRTDWLGVMRFCPTGLLNLIDSKACRGTSRASPRSPLLRHCPDSRIFLPSLSSAQVPSCSMTLSPRRKPRTLSLNLPDRSFRFSVPTGGSFNLCSFVLHLTTCS